MKRSSTVVGLVLAVTVGLFAAAQPGQASLLQPQPTQATSVPELPQVDQPGLSAPTTVDTVGVFVPDGEGLLPQPLTTSNINNLRALPGVQPMYHFAWGWVTGSIYFSMTETKLLALGGTVISWLSPLTIGGRGIAVFASLGVATGRCVVLRVSPYGYGVVGGGYYRGSWCQ